MPFIILRPRKSRSVASVSTFKQATMLLKALGLSGSNNSTFVDSSTNAATITKSGTPTQGSFNPYSSSYSVQFDGNGSALSLPNNVALSFGATNFTIEAFVNSALLRTNNFIYADCDSATNNGQLGLLLDATNKLTFGVYTSANAFGTFVTTTSVVPLNTWTHVAISRVGTTVYLAVNGVVQTFTGAVASTLRAPTSPVIGSMGAYLSGNRQFLGGISDFRIVSGTALYTSNFTPPTTKLTAITGTVVLACQSNMFKEVSSNNLAVTVNGTPIISHANPYGVAYNPSTNGGSSYFNGTNANYISVADNASLEIGTSDFIIDCWIYPTTTANQTFMSKRANNAASGEWTLSYVTGSLGFYASSTGSSWDLAGGTQFGALIPNQWYHVCYTRSGGTHSAYLNGVRKVTGGAATAFVNNTAAITIGGDTDTWTTTGYIADARLLIGTGLSGTTITVPTSPVASNANTRLLVKGVNAACVDYASNVDVVTNGNAQVSTTTVKYDKSLYFDGSSGTYIQLPNNGSIYAFGTSDFTVETWVNLSNNTGQHNIIDFRSVVGSTSPVVYTMGGAIMYYTAGATKITGTTVMTVGSWYHVALVRYSGITRLYLNGVQEGAAYTDANIYTCASDRPILGNAGDVLNTFVLNGYIEDFRITKGIALYTGAFTPSTAALPTS